jgi:superfamily II DNA or RNA helicase
MITLRDYQQEMIAGIRGALTRARRVLAQAPTGAGKTALGSFMVSQTASKGLRSMFLVHRTELLRQTAAAFLRQDIEHDTIQAGKGFNPHVKTHVGAIQTVANRLDLVPSPDLLIVDEAHHAVSESWSRVISALNPRFIVGLSATPCRLDGRGLQEQFDILVPGPRVSDLIERGFLSPYRIYAPPSAVDFSAIRTTAGDYNKADLAEAMDKPTITGDAVSHYHKITPNKRAVVFCTSIAHAEHVRDAFIAAGYSAATVDGTMKPADRAAVLSKFETGEIKVLTSCDLVSEGFDLPAIEVAISLRPTKSLSLWIQQVGRALRVCPGKEEAVILDHVGNTMIHGLPDQDREWTLDAKPRRKSDRGQITTIRQCKSCFTIHAPAPSCPTCGHVYEISAREIEQVDGELIEFDKARAKIELEKARELARRQTAQARSREALEELARARGYKPGWVDHMLKSRGARG